MKILVIGGAGFIASHLVEGLVAIGHKVDVMDDLSNGSLDNLRNVESQITFLKADVSLPQKTGFYRGYDAIYFLACFPRSQSFENPYRDLEVNYGGMVRILHDLKTGGDKPHIFFASNSGIYDTLMMKEGHSIDETYPDKPTTPYDLNKLTTEKIIQMYHHYFKIPYTLFRFATVYGPRQKLSEEWHPVVMEFCNKLLQGTPPTIDGTGDQTRDFIEVGDLVSALIAALTTERAIGETFLLSTNRETSINELYNTIEKAIGASSPPLRGPGLLGDIMRMRYDSSKAHDLLGWKAVTPLAEGVAAVIGWLEDEETRVRKLYEGKGHNEDT